MSTTNERIETMRMLGDDTPGPLTDRAVDICIGLAMLAGSIIWLVLATRIGAGGSPHVIAAIVSTAGSAVIVATFLTLFVREAAKERRARSAVEGQHADA